VIVADSSETLLERQQAELASELERTYGRDAILAVIFAAFCAGVLIFMFGRPCLRTHAFLSEVWCEKYGPWSYTRLVLLMLPNLAITAPLAFKGLRGRRRRRFWSF
jgi:hypothetical protein